MAAFRSRLSQVYKNTLNVKKPSWFKSFDKYKGGRLSKFGAYWKSILLDYSAVAKETASDMKEHPLKTTLIFSSLGLLTYCAKNNPDERSFKDQLINNIGDLLLLSDSVRNPEADKYMQVLLKQYNEGLLRYLSLGVISFMWVANHDRSCDLYEARCLYLQPQWLTFYQRIVDIGFLGQWYYLENKMIDYDINPNEFS